MRTLILECFDCLSSASEIILNLVRTWVRLNCDVQMRLRNRTLSESDENFYHEKPRRTGSRYALRCSVPSSIKFDIHETQPAMASASTCAKFRSITLLSAQVWTWYQLAVQAVSIRCQINTRRRCRITKRDSGNFVRFRWPILGTFDLC